MSNDYYRKYYCIEYLIPIAEIIFDIECPLKTDYEKTIEFLSRAILRFFD